MPEDIYEGSKVTIKLAVKRGVFKSKKATIKFETTGGQEKVADATLSIPLTGSATHELTAPLVKDDEESYALSYKVDAGDQSYDGPKTYRVWPRRGQFKAVKKEDSAAYAGVPVKITQGTNVRFDGETPSTGIVTFDLDMGSVPEFEVPSPFEVDDYANWKNEKKRKKEAKVSRQKYKAAFFWPIPGTGPHKQWVNLENELGTEKGSRLKVRVGPEGDEARAKGSKLGAKGDKIYVKVERGPDDQTSKRSFPKPAVNGAAFGGTREVAQELVLDENGEAAIDLECGCAGGDKYTVKIGVTSACSDATLEVVNWRKLWLEMIAPESSLRQSWNDLVIVDLEDKPHLDDKLKNAVKAVLTPCFLEYVDADTSCTFTEAELAEVLGGAPKVKTVVVDAAYIQDYNGKAATNGAKVFIPPKKVLVQLQAKKNSNSADRRCLTTIWCDRMSDKASGADTPVVSVFENATPKEKELGYHVFKYDPVKADLSLGVKSISWQVTQYKDGADWKDVADGTPGADKQAPQDVDVSTLANIEPFVEFVHSRKVKFKLPARGTHPDDPGHFLNKDGHEFKVSLSVTFVRVDFGTNASALEGDIKMTTQFGNGKPEGIARTLTHETGHNLGHTYFRFVGPGEIQDGGSDLRGRLPHFIIPGVDFATLVPKDEAARTALKDAGAPYGQFFAGKGFAGPHCAFALVKQQKTNEDKPILTQASYKVPANAVRAYFNAAKAEHCVLWASGDMASETPQKFCDECLKYIKATDGRDIKRSWKVDKTSG